MRALIYRVSVRVDLAGLVILQADAAVSLETYLERVGGGDDATCGRRLSAEVVKTAATTTDMADRRTDRRTDGRAF